MPYSVEITGDLFIANHERLVAGSDGKTDVVIAEVKSGKNSTPNAVWKKMGASHPAIPYIVRFVGLHDESELIPPTTVHTPGAKALYIRC